MTEIDTQSINLIAVGNEGGKTVLSIGLKEAYRDKPQYLRYLKKEYERAKELDNPNIFKILDFKDTDNGPVIVAEWEDSRTLAEWLKEEDHTDDEKKRIVRQVASALDYMHSQGVVSGNLNSHNVFVTRNGDQAKLLVVRLRYTDILKQPNDTLKYLAPEAKDGTVAIDAKADIYSLGIMLKDMGFMPEYAPVIGTCCRFGRNERFEDVDEFLEALDRRRYSRAASNPEEISTPTASTNKRMAVIVAIIVVLVGIVVALIVAQGGGGDDQAAQQPATTEQVEGDDQTTTSSDMDSTAKQQPLGAVPSDSTGAAFTGDNAFLNDLVPQMHADLDKIFNSGADKRTINHKVAVYYKGLRRVLSKKGLNSAQMDAFDQQFSEYVKGKRQLPVSE